MTAPDRKKAPGIAGFTDLSMPHFDRVILPNGVTIHWLDGCEEDVSRISLIWMAGYLDTPRLATLNVMEELFVEGCVGHTGVEVSDTLESCGAWFRASASGHSLCCSLKGINKTASTVLPLMRDMVAAPLFPETSLEAVVQKMAAAREVSLKRPSVQAALICREAVYGPGSSLSFHLTPDEIRNTTRSELLAVHRNLCLSAPPVIFLSGRIADSLLALVGDVFGNMEFITDNPEAIVRHAVSHEPLKQSVEVSKDMPRSLQTGVRIQIPTIDRRHPHFMALRIAVMALGGYFGSRLMSNVREDKGYTYGISASTVSTIEGSSVVISTECDNCYVRPLLAEVDNEINRLASETLPDEEMTAVRNVLLSSAANLLDSPFSISGYKEMLATTGQPDDTFAKNFREIMSVTPADVRDAARRYILEAPRVTALAGHQPG